MPDTTRPQVALSWQLDNSYRQLPDKLYASVRPQPVAEPRLVLFNHALAAELGLLPAEPGVLSEMSGISRASELNAQSGQMIAAQLAGNRLPDGAEPLAQAYAGHQFGHLTMLGDGRAVLLGEQIAPDGGRWDIQLKGSGQTPYSRSGDGRATLSAMLREYLISEAMAGLGIPTSRSLAVVASGEQVYRDQAEPGAVLTRVAPSHIRVGTFEYVSYGLDETALVTLMDYTLARHFPKLAAAELSQGEQALALFQAVMERQLSLIIDWMRVGFIHGVMNTDNMSLAGFTFDYGPCAFINRYDPKTVFSSIDRQGRYAFGNQPQIGQWNLGRFASTLLSLIDSDREAAVARIQPLLNRYSDKYQRRWLAMMRRKLGLEVSETVSEQDKQLADDLLTLMQRQQADYTDTFRSLLQREAAGGALAGDSDFVQWRERWLARIADNPGGWPAAEPLMRQANPAFIPRNHLVEQALQNYTEQGDPALYQQLLALCADPCSDRPEHALLPAVPEGFDDSYATYCGT